MPFPEGGTGAPAGPREMSRWEGALVLAALSVGRAGGRWSIAGPGGLSGPLPAAARTAGTCSATGALATVTPP